MASSVSAVGVALYYRLGFVKHTGTLVEFGKSWDFVELTFPQSS